MMGKLIQESGESYSCSTVLYINTIWGHASMELKCVQTLRKSKVYVHATTLRSQNAEQLRENGWLRCRCKPQSFKTYDSSELGVWSSGKGSVQTAKLTKNYDQKTIEESHHYVVRTYSIVSSHVHMDCQTSASAGESFIHLAGHNLHRACIYCNLDPAWVQFGSSWDPAWIQLGSSLDPAWT